MIFLGAIDLLVLPLDTWTFLLIPCYDGTLEKQEDVGIWIYPIAMYVVLGIGTAPERVFPFFPPIYQPTDKDANSYNANNYCCSYASPARIPYPSCYVSEQS